MRSMYPPDWFTSWRGAGLGHACVVCRVWHATMWVGLGHESVSYCGSMTMLALSWRVQCSHLFLTTSVSLLLSDRSLELLLRLASYRASLHPSIVSVRSSASPSASRPARCWLNWFGGERHPAGVKFT